MAVETRFSGPCQVRNKRTTRSCWRISELIVEGLNGLRCISLKTIVAQHIGSPILRYGLSDELHRLASHLWECCRWDRSSPLLPSLAGYVTSKLGGCLASTILRKAYSCL